MRKNKQCHFVGDRYKTKYGVEYEIIKYNYSRDITIRFDCGYETSVQGVSIHRGSVQYPLHKTCMGIGYLGFGKHKATIGNKRTDAYTKWYNMFVRCYDRKDIKRNIVYKDVEVCEEWHNFQTFADWFEENNIEGLDLHLDKDLTVRWANSYSPETCSLIPPSVNMLMTDHRADRGGLPIGVGRRGNVYCSRCFDGNGVMTWLGVYKTPEEAFSVYKEYKESVMKQVADKFKSILTDKVYNNLMTWEVYPYPELERINFK